MSAKITFYGGAGAVTGANFMLDTGAQKLLIDCGAHEREKKCDPENLKPFAYDPKTVEALFVTHAHEDHIGRIPKLVHEGFRGKIFSTPATKDLSAIMFDDALTVMENERERYGCDLVYEKEDVERALSLWETREYHDPFPIGDTEVEFLDAGHILGSAMVKLTRGGRVIIFTGDIGNSPEPLLNDVEAPAGANYLVMESVYGDRLHEERSKRQDILKHAVLETRRKHSVLLIPSFSIERTQIILYELGEMMLSGEITLIPVYFDAPLAIRITEVFEKYRSLLKPLVQEGIADGHDPFAFSSLMQTSNVAQSHGIHNLPDPKIIIAGAGMSSGGRVRFHEKLYLPDERATVLITGYQAPGSLGRRIQDGQKHIVIDGEDVQVRASVVSLTGYSGHADRDQLLSFVESAGQSLKKVFVTMGEPRASLFFAQRVHDFLDVQAVAPTQGESATIDW